MIQEDNSNEIYVPWEDENDDGSTFFLPITVKWLDYTIYYSPMWIPTKSNGQRRSCIVNTIGIFVATTATLFYFACDMYTTIIYWSEYNDIDNMVWICLKSLDLIERVLSIIYCYVYFNWPWKYQYPLQLSNQNQNIRKLSTRYKFIYTSLFVCYIVVDIIAIYVETKIPYPYDPYLLASKLFTLHLFVVYPQCLVCVIQSIIFLKYYLYLHQLYDELINTYNFDIHDIHANYDYVYKAFMEDYHWTLRKSVQTFLLSQIILVWSSVDWFQWKGICVQTIKVSFAFILYLYSASMLEDIYRKFECELWKSGPGYLNDKVNEDGRLFYNYTLQYVQKYPIYVTFGSVIVSKTNAIKFCIGMVLTKAVSYGIKSWFEQHY